MDALEKTLASHRLLKPDAPRPRDGASLLEWCDAGVLEGGLSIAPDVRPDECLGPLLLAVGGSATQVRVVDVREGKQGVSLSLSLSGREFVWRVRDIPALVRAVNRAFAQDPHARFIWQLGDREGRLQLWCVAKKLRTRLGRTLAAHLGPAEREDTHSQ